MTTTSPWIWTKFKKVMNIFDFFFVLSLYSNNICLYARFNRLDDFKLPFFIIAWVLNAHSKFAFNYSLVVQ